MHGGRRTVHKEDFFVKNDKQREIFLFFLLIFSAFDTFYKVLVRYPHSNARTRNYGKSIRVTYFHSFIISCQYTVVGCVTLITKKNREKNFTYILREQEGEWNWYPIKNNIQRNFCCLRCSSDQINPQTGFSISFNKQQF